ncbi:SDR family NAD(P)-dependent oxidoreductase [Rhodococcus sp. IEGM 1330]|uniref:SDR family NAD(P)-dependent oxidoreductase n=1 Tax=Rhodococcus sp. IEGM 1330 TaxID=3082225 RepID=UPI0029550440|nr:SDR family oxidoreductase [Rhodococcus sp. IEGM 1330]MDV8025335.1 SDR family oxidoreductase [Rhodococcus sp. IEGM 1330]
MTNSNPVVLISGAGRGIGAETARTMGRRGYHVIVNYRSNKAAADGVVSDISGAGGTAESQQADVTNEDQVNELVQQAFDRHGRIDALICNANTVDPPFQSLLSVPWDAFIGKVTGELAGAFFLTRSLLPIMQRSRTGRIVFISSTAADSVGSTAAHSTAKAALNTFSRHVAAYAAEHGITVNTVALAMVRTDASSPYISEALQTYTQDRSVVGRIMNTVDVATTIAAVAADEGFRATVGQVIRVDAGYDVLDQQLHPTTKFFQ